MTDRGAKTLAERLLPFFPNMTLVGVGRVAKALLGLTGLFIADVTKHEPDAPFSLPRCKCGWTKNDHPDESYFDHIGATE